MLLFPCNQFLSQEPEQPTPALARRLSKDSLVIDEGQKGQAILMSRVDVNGKNASPVYEFLKYNSSLYSESGGTIGPLRWNFTKFLVNPNGGGVYKYYGPKDSWEHITADIDLLLSPERPTSTARKGTTSSLEARASE
mmetsp:Transcript_58140/g.170001  ORF Transcript_58140/g.170001 Transcript_58140/m.170001 type:complete len:138 (-) Transcript_58140:153-566(-)